MFLPSLISYRRPTDHVESPEDFLSSSLSSLFTDDVRNQHGDGPDTTIVYHSRKFGDIELRTADVSGRELTDKFAHCLWNAGILMTELVGGKPGDENASRDLDCEEGDGGNREWWVPEDEEELWGVKGETVLELGAGLWI
jgi:nicotinamide N-methyltransferase